MKCSVERVLAYLSFLTLTLLIICPAAHAIDPRFDLDTRTLDSKLEAGRKNSPPPHAENKKPKKRTVRSGGVRAVSQKFKLLKQVQTERRNELSGVRGVWDQLIPSRSVKRENIHVTGQNYELSLDPERFPVLPAADGGRILVDPGGTLPPLVKSLVQAADGVRVVSEDTGNTQKFYSSLLAESRFFSVTENFSVEFGNDAKLSVTSDFKIEKSPESLMKRDLVLLNVTEARSGTPQALVSFLSQQGFQLIEPYPATRREKGVEGHRIHRISGANATDIADRLMESVGLRYLRQERVELFGPSDSGMRLDIQADRYFERGGERFIISRFNGDPVFYTLVRLLETRGYRVIILEDTNNFRTVAEKLLSVMKIPARFDTQRLWPTNELPYNVQLPGFMLRDQDTGRKVVLTGAEIDPLINELVTLNGFTVFPAQ